MRCLQWQAEKRKGTYEFVDAATMVDDVVNAKLVTLPGWVVVLRDCGVCVCVCVRARVSVWPVGVRRGRLDQL